MSFKSGQVNFYRFRVAGDVPTVDEAFFAKLREHAFKKTEIGEPAETEFGWVTGQYLDDVNLTYERCGFGGGAQLLFAIRIDTHKIPSSLKMSVRHQLEVAALKRSKSPFLSRIEKKEIADAADRQLHVDLVAGKFCRSKMVPVMWDLANQVLYLGDSSEKSIGSLSTLFRKTFNLGFDPITAGGIAGEALSQAKRIRDYEDLRPTGYSMPLMVATTDGSTAIPRVEWADSSVNLKDFLGNEFLIWLWFVTECQEGTIDCGDREIAVVLDHAIDMDCAYGLGGKQTLRGDGVTRLPEAGKALGTGKWPRKARMILASVADRLQWELTLQADRWIVSSATLPDCPDAQSPAELITQRIERVIDLADTLDAIFRQFVVVRTGPNWTDLRREIKAWMGKKSGITQG